MREALGELGRQRTALKYRRGELYGQMRELEKHPEYCDSSDWGYAYDGHGEYPVGPFTPDWLEAKINTVQEALWDVDRQINAINVAIEAVKSDDSGRVGDGEE